MLIRSISAISIACTLAAGAALADCSATHSAQVKQASSTETGGEKMTQKVADTKSMNLVEVAATAGSFNTLVAAVKAAGLVETLAGEGPFTVFAPTDEAFAKLPEGTLQDLLKPENKGKLTAILNYHVVPGRVMAADVVELTSAKTAQGQDVAISVHDHGVHVGGANVVKTDVVTSNGVIHVIDAVMLPPTL